MVLPGQSGLGARVSATPWWSDLGALEYSHVFMMTVIILDVKTLMMNIINVQSVSGKASDPNAHTHENHQGTG
jgi:hypothetical protein